VKLLFDSHSLVWFLTGDDRFPGRLRAPIAEAEKVISAACVWEIATKVARGSWPEAERVAATLDDILEHGDYLALPITILHAKIASWLPGRHRDPFDRMLAAQAQVEALPLLTADPVFAEFGVQVVW
jgi:PIN domain nuclease of toxin-antitoxin system